MLPKLPVISPPPFSPLTLDRVEPDRVKPLLVPERVPPELVKLTPLFAKVAIGNDSRSSARKNSFLGNMLEPHLPTKRQTPVRGFYGSNTIGFLL
jgi:hypothetical protein